MEKFSSYLQLTPHGTYYFRIAIPQSLRLYFGKRELKKTLRTSDRKKAISIAMAMSIEANKLFKRAYIMGGNNNDDKNPTLYHAALLFTKDGIKEEIDSDKDIDKEIEALNKLREARKTDIEAFKKSLKSKKNQTIIASEATSILLSKLIEMFVSHNKTKGNWTAKTEDDYQSTFTLLLEVMGDIPVSRIIFQKAEDFVITLQKLPKNIKTSPLYRSKSIDEILASKPKDVISGRTVNKKLGFIITLFKWAKKNGYVSNNYFEDLKVKVRKKAYADRVPFLNEELKRIFSTEIYTQHKFKYPYYYWIPLIGLYTGARLEEICQLNCSDIRQESGIWIFDINAMGDDKKVKTASSNRLTPVHAKLIEFGLLDYQQSLVEKGRHKLFPELKPDAYGKYSAQASKWFGRLRKKLEFYDLTPKKDFHSFRHTTVNNLRQQNVPEDQIATIVGHEHKTQTSSYGNKYNIGVLKPIVDKLNFDEPLKNVTPWK